MKTEQKTEPALIVAEEASQKVDAVKDKQTAKTNSKKTNKDSSSKDSTPQARKKAGALFLVSETELNLDRLISLNL